MPVEVAALLLAASIGIGNGKSRRRKRGELIMFLITSEETQIRSPAPTMQFLVRAPSGSCEPQDDLRTLAGVTCALDAAGNDPIMCRDGSKRCSNE